MISRIPDLPQHVLGFSASGTVTEADYESTIIPAVEAHLASQPKVRLLFHLGSEFDRFEAGALWDDAKLGLRHPAAWEKVAVVSDVEWIRTATRIIGFVLPGEARVFRNSELPDARGWISS